MTQTGKDYQDVLVWLGPTVGFSPDILKVKEHCAPRLRPSPGLILGTTQKSADRVRAARNVL